VFRAHITTTNEKSVYSEKNPKNKEISTARAVTAEQIEELKEHRRIKSKEYRQRMRQNPDRVERERIRGRRVAKEYYQRMSLDCDWVERRNARVRPKWREWYHRPENKERRKQAGAERRAVHKQRMLNDPHYAYYHREYLKALYREKTGRTEMDILLRMMFAEQ
jgi:hypothetical protein